MLIRTESSRTKSDNEGTGSKHIPRRRPRSRGAEAEDLPESWKWFNIALGLTKKKNAHHSCHHFFLNRMCSFPTSSCSALIGFFPCPFSSALILLSSSTDSELDLISVARMVVVGAEKTRRRCASPLIIFCFHMKYPKHHRYAYPMRTSASHHPERLCRRHVRSNSSPTKPSRA
jgi:hypothetical protein